MDNFDNLKNLMACGSITYDDIALAVGRWLLVDDGLHVALLDNIAAALPEGAQWLRDGSVLAPDAVNLEAILSEAVADVLEDVRINYPGLED